jgi:hypothetical protein
MVVRRAQSLEAAYSKAVFVHLHLRFEIDKPEFGRLVILAASDTP